MQRRVAALYFVLFVLVGAGAFGFIQVGMTEPTLDLSGEPLAENETLTVDGRTYTVTEVTREESGGGEGHGGGDEAPIVGTMEWTNDSARGSATLANDTTAAYRGEDYRVVVANESGVSEFELVAVQNVTGVVAADPAANRTVTDDETGQRFVVYRNGTTAPLSTYLPEPRRLSFAEGQQLEYAAESGTVTATVANVTPAAVRLAWTFTATNEIDLSEGANLTLNGQPYFVHFPDESGVQVLPVNGSYDSYQQQLARIDAFEERRNGVWGVVILSVLAAIVLLSTAYLPVK